MKRSIRYAAALAACLTLGLWGCRASNPSLSGGQGTMPNSQVPTDSTQTNPTEDLTTMVTVPFEKIEATITTTRPFLTSPTQPGLVTGEGESVDMKTVRAQDVSQAQMERLVNQYTADQIALVHVTERAQLDRFLTEAGSQTLTDSCKDYTEQWFETHDLAIMPRVTNTGSARHSVTVQVDGETVYLNLRVDIPEISTCDMAHWFLLTPLDKTDTQNRTVRAVQSSSGLGVTPLLPQPSMPKVTR